MSEDRKGLQNFATLLTSCRNTLKSIGYSIKIENPDSLRSVINRLPYDLRKKWRNTAAQISEDQEREIKFEDIVVFIEKQTRAPTPNQSEKALQSKGKTPTREEAMKARRTPLVKEWKSKELSKVYRGSLSA